MTRRHSLPRAFPSRWTSVGSRSTTASSSASPSATSPPRFGAHGNAIASFRPAGGESLAEVDARVAAACEELFASDGFGARAADGDVVVVSHVTPIKAAVAWALGMTADLYWRLHLRTASVTRIGWGNGHPVLHGFNEVVPGRDGATPQRVSP